MPFIALRFLFKSLLAHVGLFSVLIYSSQKMHRHTLYTSEMLSLPQRQLNNCLSNFAYTFNAISLLFSSGIFRTNTAYSGLNNFITELSVLWIITDSSLVTLEK